MIASDILAPVLPLIPVPRRAEALDNFDTHHHANALDTNSGTHRTGQPSNTLDIRQNTLDTQPSDTLDHPNIILTPHYQYEPPPRRCIGHTTTGMHWTGQPTTCWTYHLNDALDHPNIILTPHFHYALPPMRLLGHNASATAWAHHPSDALDMQPLRHLGQTTPAMLWTCYLCHTLDNSPMRRVGHATSPTI